MEALIGVTDTLLARGVALKEERMLALDQDGGMPVEDLEGEMQNPSRMALGELHVMETMQILPNMVTLMAMGTAHPTSGLEIREDHLASNPEIKDHLALGLETQGDSIKVEQSLETREGHLEDHLASSLEIRGGHTKVETSLETREDHLALSLETKGDSFKVETRGHSTRVGDNTKIVIRTEISSMEVLLRVACRTCKME